MQLVVLALKLTFGQGCCGKQNLTCQDLFLSGNILFMTSYKMPFIDDVICSEAELYLFGGCITSWKVASKDLLFVRPDAVFNGQKPIRFTAILPELITFKIILQKWRLMDLYLIITLQPGVLAFHFE